MVKDNGVVYKKQFCDLGTGLNQVSLYDQTRTYSHAEDTFGELVDGLGKLPGAVVRQEEVDGRRFASVDDFSGLHVLFPMSSTIFRGPS